MVSHYFCCCWVEQYLNHFWESISRTSYFYLEKRVSDDIWYFLALHKKRSFPLRISSFSVQCMFLTITCLGHIKSKKETELKHIRLLTFFFVQSGLKFDSFFANTNVIGAWVLTNLKLRKNEDQVKASIINSKSK